MKTAEEIAAVDELISRLREGKAAPYVDPFARDVWNRDGFEAAALIEQLRAENARLVVALAEIASMGYAGAPDIRMRQIARDALNQETTHDRWDQAV